MQRFLQAFICLAALALPFAAHASGTSSVYIEDLTWMEIRDRLQSGTTVVIIPTGGTEQNGPHMVTGKHNTIVRYTAGEIAKRLGDTLVAPVVAYVPEGRISPPEGHMQFPGTVSLSEETFAHMLEDIAGSYRSTGFKLICFMGDHGGSQAAQQQVADKLTSEWASSGVRVVNVSDYYGNNGQDKWVQAIGLKIPGPSNHAGFEDTSELMALNAAGVRSNLRAAHSEKDYFKTGAMGDSTESSADYGKKLLSLKIAAGVKQINDITHHAD